VRCAKNENRWPVLFRDDNRRGAISRNCRIIRVVKRIIYILIRSFVYRDNQKTTIVTKYATKRARSKILSIEETEIVEPTANVVIAHQEAIIRGT